MKEFKWGVLGCGSIANEMAKTLAANGRSFFSAANRTHEKAEAFAEQYGISRVYGSPDELFLDEDVDIVYIATTHNVHYEYIKKALENGKHVLAEKAICLNSSQLSELSELAESKGLILAEAMTVYHMPLYKEIRRRMDNGDFGKVQIITMNFGSFKEYDLSNRFFNLSLGGGALLDIGVYALSELRFFLSSKPDEVLDQWKLSPTGSDEMAVMILKNAEEQMAAVAMSIHSKQPKRAMISFEKGYLEITEYPRAAEAFFTDAQSGERTRIAAGKHEDALYYEVLDMEEAVRTGNAGGMHLDYSRDVMDIMTGLRREWGLVYPEEMQ